MRRYWALIALGLAVWPAPSSGRKVPGFCGTYRERVEDGLERHRRAARFRPHALGPAAAAGAPAAGKDGGPTGDLAIIYDSEGVITRRDDFDLDRKTLTFTPSGASYRFALSSANTYDAAAAAAGTRLDGLGDDDTRPVGLPFPFPFFGVSWRSVFINSDGNLTFGAADTASLDRSLGRLTAGPPRLAPLFEDLDPTRSANGVYVLADSGRFVVSWVSVPEYSDFGVGALQTFQARLYPDGRIEFAWSGAVPTSAVVGIAPGRLQGSSSLVAFIDGSTAEYSGAVAERFSPGGELDLVMVAQKFYETHEDAYDYLVVFNNLGILDGPDSIAHEETLRNRVKGIGDFLVDFGAEYGSPRRLKSLVHMAALSQYGAMDQPLRLRPIDTPLTTLAHEAGHLFLAYASVRDPVDPNARPMLGYQNAHWSFNFNSDASLEEGNRILDRGSSTRPRFRTTAVSQGYAALDQYLMGLRPPEEVPALQDLFYVLGSGYANTTMPQAGVGFDGVRRDVSIGEVVAAEGRRIPDHTVAQRTYHFAFLLVTLAGAEPSAADLQQVEDFRRAFEQYVPAATAGNAVAETTLRRALRFSLAPAGGVIQGKTAAVTVSIEHPATADLAIALTTPTGYISAPPSVTIPAGAASAGFSLAGLDTGVGDLVLTPADPRYETARARIQVAGSASLLKLALLSGDRQLAQAGVPLQPVVFQVVDRNELPYPGMKVLASVTGGGTVTPAAGATDETGTITLQWTPGAGPLNQLTVALDGAPASAVILTALGRPAVNQGGVVNAASYGPLVAPGSLASIFGVNLAGAGDVSVLLNGSPAQLLAVTDLQINFLVSSTAAPGPASLVVRTTVGDSAPAPFAIVPAGPGIFYDTATGLGAILIWNSGGKLTDAQPARPGQDWLEIYSTGLGAVHANGSLYETDQPVKVMIGSLEAESNFSGLAPGYVGLYQVNALVPAGTPSGAVPVALEIAGQRSNSVNVQVQ